ncbi:MAG: WecB/TagA/CpsF family glycosyltransferase [bacterium]|nr:WecB/TagA/CpsF family glycosyltransferase [bacterium]
MGIRVDKVKYLDVLKKIEEFILSKKPHMLAIPNVEICMLARVYPEFKNILNSADLLMPDGVGIYLASKILGDPLPERTTGTDLMYVISDFASKKGFSMYLLGAKPGIAEKAKRNLVRKYPNLKIIGIHHGYFDKDEEKTLIEEIKTLKPNILVVCLGMYKQEKWIKDNMENLGVPVCFGNGGALDFVSKCTRRSPVWMQKMGLEWLYRLFQEPWRIKRQIVLPKFVLLVLKERIFRRRRWLI